MEDRQMICDRCRNSVPIPEMKLVAKGDSAIALCNQCRQEAEQQKKKAKPMPSIEVEKSKYFCGRCKYKFKFDDSRETKLKCPYCDKTDKVMLNNPESAENLLKESTTASDRGAYFCNRCKYKFNFEKTASRTRVSCPYCGRGDMIE